MDKNVDFTVSLGTNDAEARLDRLLAKAEQLKAILSEITALEKAEATEEPLPNIVYTINLGGIKELLAAPVEAFSPAFLKEVSDNFLKIAGMKAEDVAIAKNNVRERASANAQHDTGEYKKKSSIVKPLIIPKYN